MKKRILVCEPDRDVRALPETVAYLIKPVGRARLGAGLAGALAP